jgi:hypothetical protein
MEIHGFLIVLKQDVKIAQWQKKHKANDQFNVYIGLLRETFNSVNPISYKGIDRYPLEAYTEEDILKHPPDDSEYTKKARIKMYDILNSKQKALLMYEDFNDDENMFTTMKDAITVYNLLQNKGDYEIIELYRNKYNLNETFLGFDIGYWGSDHFSLISDIFIAPQWHPADPKDFDILLNYIKDLNKNLLFNTEIEAMKFREFYKNAEWAELDTPYSAEETEFQIIQIQDVKLEKYHWDKE